MAFLRLSKTETSKNMQKSQCKSMYIFTRLRNIYKNMLTLEVLLNFEY